MVVVKGERDQRHALARVLSAASDYGRELL
jgi:hypothetical protein